MLWFSCVPLCCGISMVLWRLMRNLRVMVHGLWELYRVVLLKA